VADTDLNAILREYFPFGFPTSERAWATYAVTSLLQPGKPFQRRNIDYSTRRLADRFNEWTGEITYHVPPIHAEHLLCLGILTDALRYLSLRYCFEDCPGVIDRGLEMAQQRLGDDSIDNLRAKFVRLFPPGKVMVGACPPESFLVKDRPAAGQGVSLSVEMILLFITMRNPAARSYRALFDDRELQRLASYVPFVVCLEEFFDQEPAASATAMTLFNFLRAPMLASPDSLEGQISYILEHWSQYLPEHLIRKLDLAQNIIKEIGLERSLEPGAPPVLEFGRNWLWADDAYPEAAAFSHDADWMSNVALMAKSVYVWLDQLSQLYQRHIHRLDQIPDRELDRLARWGFTGLWLIGVWERSPASGKIKRYMGNPEALSSAYSLYDYTIAAALGGEEALADLQRRTAERGIRLASDMVPNHMGIDSRWIIEHPDWFLQVDQPPFPVYAYAGGDLCDDERVSIRIEDGYWEHRDAAVVFQRVDNATGDVRYIYHGNDGTSMPWNDTAQLNFLLPELREAVIQTILHVARQFSIIRFDAAMTLAKKHYQRLWFPRPGDAGAIPSRAEHTMNRPEFDAVFPQEFWREVVDRVAAEVPDTLLLAEAFWLMEGYFVRTLGMHRVYNSAFMNMLKLEENSKYRQTVKNVLEFSPEVLKRFVNFMNNPDERTAVEQFGKGDKYFGVSVMMVTMPGLPMFGHGQIEGFSEKYGMEYRRAYWDEHADPEMIARHEREIFPLLRRRHLFSGAENFAFYDFQSPAGWVDENVFAYSNRTGTDRALILYNNNLEATTGRIQLSTPINVGAGDDTHLARRTLAQALLFDASPGCYYAFRDAITGTEFLRSGEQLDRDGFYAALRGYQYCAYVDFREIRDTDGSWYRLQRTLGADGVESIDIAYREMLLEAVLTPFRAVVEAAFAVTTGPAASAAAREAASGTRSAAAAAETVDAAQADFRTTVREFFDAAVAHSGTTVDSGALTDAVVRETDGLHAAQIGHETAVPIAPADDDPASAADHEPVGDLRPVLLLRAVVRQLGRLELAMSNPAATGAAGVETIANGEGVLADTGLRVAALQLAANWLLDRTVFNVCRQLLGDEDDAAQQMLLIRILIGHEDLLRTRDRDALRDALSAVFRDEDARRFLQVNCHEETWYFNRERLLTLLQGLYAVTAVDPDVVDTVMDETSETIRENLDVIAEAAATAGYQVTKLGELLETDTPSA